MGVRRELCNVTIGSVNAKQVSQRFASHYKDAALVLGQQVLAVRAELDGPQIFPQRRIQ